MRILGIIPARGGSKGIPGKNIKLLGNKPLLSYTWESACESNLLTRTVLSTEDDRIIKVAQELGIEVPFKRPISLAKDNTTTLAVIVHLLKHFTKKNEIYDAVCILQPTAPFRRKNLIDKAISKFVNLDVDSLITVREVPARFNPHWVFKAEYGRLKTATGDRKIIPRRQDLPKAFHRDGAIYLTKTEVILNEASLYGKQIGYIDTSNDPYVNLDMPGDWEKAERMLEKIRRL